MENDDARRAVEILQRSTKVRESSPSTWFKLAGMFRRLGRVEEAVNAEEMARLKSNAEQRARFNRSVRKDKVMRAHALAEAEQRRAGRQL